MNHKIIYFHLPIVLGHMLADWPWNETHGRLGGTICPGMYMTSWVILNMHQSITCRSNKKVGGV